MLLPLTHANAIRRNFAWIFLFAPLAAISGCGAETDPERITAAWVLANGGHVTVKAGGDPTEIAAGASLPGGALEVIGVAWDIYPGDDNPRVTDAEVPHFTRLPHLKSLDLWASDITDASLADIATISTLETLILTDTQVTDVGLTQLAKLKNLNDLSLIGTKVTPAGIAKLKRALPACRVRK